MCVGLMLPREPSVTSNSCKNHNAACKRCVVKSNFIATATTQDIKICDRSLETHLDVVVFGPCDHQVLVVSGPIHCQTHHWTEVTSKFPCGCKSGETRRQNTNKHNTESIIYLPVFNFGSLQPWRETQVKN